MMAEMLQEIKIVSKQQPDYIDLNKNPDGVTFRVSTTLGTSGITDNFLDKPERISISGKETIKILCDPDGSKLQQTSPAVNDVAWVTTYFHEFVYQNDSLSHIGFEEGKIK